MPRISENFTVAQPIERVWEFLQQIPEIVTCLPGLELLGEPEPQHYTGRLRVKLGAVSAAFEGEATIKSVDHATYSTSLTGKGVDRKGGSRAQSEFTYRLTDRAGQTLVTVDADITLSGPLAQFGRTGILNDVAHEMTAQFAANLEAKMAAMESTSESSSDAVAKAQTPPPAAATHARTEDLNAARMLFAIVRGRWRALLRWLGIST